MQVLKRGLSSASRFAATSHCRTWSRNPTVVAHIRCLQTQGNEGPRKSSAPRVITRVYDMDWQPPSVDVELRTLLKDHLIPGDFVDLSNSRGVAYNPAPFALAPKQTPYLTYGRRHKLVKDNRVIQYTPFPVNTRGFFYYRQHPRVAEGGSIRFRVMQTNDPTQFMRGQDLLNEYGTPWEIPLISVATNTRYEVIKELLEFEGAVSRKLFARCEMLAGSIGHQNIGPMTQVIYETGEPFYLDLGSPDLAIWIVAKDMLCKMTVRDIFKLWQKTLTRGINYDGGILRCALAVYGPHNDSIGLMCQRIIEPVQVKSTLSRHMNGFALPPVPARLLRTPQGPVRKLFVHNLRQGSEQARETLLQRHRGRYDIRHSANTEAASSD